MFIRWRVGMGEGLFVGGGMSHECGQGVALGGGLPVGHHVEQQVDEDGGHELGGVVDDLEWDGHPQQAPGGLPARPPLPHVTRFGLISNHEISPIPPLPPDRVLPFTVPVWPGLHLQTPQGVSPEQTTILMG